MVLIDVRRSATGERKYAHRESFRGYSRGERGHGGGEPVRGGEAPRRRRRGGRRGDRGRDRVGGPRRRLRGETRGDPFPASLPGALFPPGPRGRPREEGEVHRGSRASGAPPGPQGGEAEEAFQRGVRRPRSGRGRGRPRDRRGLLRRRSCVPATWRVPPGG